MLGGFPSSFDTPAAIIAPEARTRYMHPDAAAWLQAQQLPAVGFMHDPTHEHLIHSIPPQQQQPAYSLGAGFDTLSSMYIPQISSYNDFTNQLTPTQASARARAMLPALNIPEAQSLPHLVAVQGDDSPQYMQSSSSTGNIMQPQSADFLQRRFDNSSNSSPTSKRHSIDSSLFARASTKGRQRTAQACEKCRDRKTKCSGERPTCKRCADRGLECVWAPEIRIRGTQRIPQRSRRLGSAGSVDSPAIQATPISGSTSASPSPPPFDLSGSNSAPAAQTSFPKSSRSAKRLKQENGRESDLLKSTASDASIMYSVNKGQDALEVMGIPVRPITSFDDCWDTVNGAQTVTPGWEKAFNMLRQRGRAASISVAHLARDKFHTQGAISPPTYFDYGFGDMTDPSPPDSNRQSLIVDDISNLDFSKQFQLSGAMNIDTLPPLGASDDIAELMSQFKWPAFDANANDQSPIERFTFPGSIDPLAPAADSIEQSKEPRVAQPQPTSHEIMDQFFNIDDFNTAF